MQHRKEETFAAIERYIEEYRDASGGTTPTLREIAAKVGIALSTAHDYVEYMKEHGMLVSPGRRSIVTKKSRADAAGFCRTPVLGGVSCGLPKYAEENIEEYVRLPVAIFGSGDFFLLRANGESMIEAGIDDGDLVLIRQQDTAEDGQIVVALVGDEATLKRIYRENGRIRLHPENETMEDIFVDSCIVQGVAVKVIKDLE